MKRKMISKWNVERAKEYRLGRWLCSLAGDENGAVMMEYVIIAVLIAAACVAAVAMFGGTITGMFDVAAKGATGNATGAAGRRGEVKTEQGTNANAAADYHNNMHESDVEVKGKSE